MRDLCISIGDLAAECSGDCLVAVTPEKKLLYANHSARQLLGLEEGALFGDLPCCDVLRMNICHDECPSLRATQKGETVNNYFVRREGSNRLFCVSTSPLCDSDGTRLGVIHSIKNMDLVSELIAEKERTQDHLQRSRVQLQAILESIADGVFAVDSEERITHFSRSMERITGLRAAAVIGQTCRSVLHGSACEAACPIRQTLSEGAGVEGHQEQLATTGGELIPVSITTALLRDQDRSAGVVCSVQDRTEIEQLRRQLKERGRFPELVGGGKKMLELFELIDSVCKTDVTVFVQGETGSGKEMVARAVHELSSRSQGPFVAVNCAVISPFLIESELFGHARGSFTGAVRDRKGKFEAAEGGTLFLDEISEMPQETQVKLLRFLERKEFERVGETVSRRVDARIITATNRTPQELAQEGILRRDLYFRLNVVPISVPPLRARKEDIPLLVEHFIHKHRKLNQQVEGVATSALRQLIDYDWPGNVRELESAIIYALASCTGKRIERKSLPPDLRRGPAEIRSRAVVEPLESPEPTAIEKQRIVQALRDSNWRVGSAATALGYHRTTLWRRIQSLKINLPNRQA